MVEDESNLRAGMAGGAGLHPRHDKSRQCHPADSDRLRSGIRRCLASHDIVSCLCPRRPEPARFERSGWRGAAFGAAIARRSGVWWPSRLATAPRCGVFPTPAAYESLIAACLKTRIAGFGRAPLRSGGVPARWAGIARPADELPKPRIRTSPLTHQSHGPVRPLIG